MVKLDLDFRCKIKLPCLYDNLSITEKAQVRAEYSRRQRGLCYYCKAPLNGTPPVKILKKKLVRVYPPEFFKNPIHLHHDHVTGFTIGATHAQCNAVLFEYHGE
jgi:hypothetical protein